MGQEIKWTTMNNRGSCFKSMRFVLNLGKVCGVFLSPEGYSSKSSVKIKPFKKLYTFMVLMLLIIQFIRYIILTLNEISGIKSCIYGHKASMVKIISPLCHRGGSFFAFVIFIFWLSPKWMELRKKWNEIEIQLYRFHHSLPKFERKLKIITAIFTLAASIEHLWWVIVKTTTRNVNSKTCSAWLKNDSTNYILEYHDGVTGNVAYTIGENVLFATTIINSFVWIFTDLFIIMISTELAEKFKYLNKATKHSKIWENHEEYWHQLRLNYSNLSKLVKKTDQLISPLILIFCLQYCIFICSSLTYGITLDNSSNLESAYTIFVIGFLIIKMSVIFFSMARLHDHSKIILPIIHDCPTSKFTLETQRLQYQVTNDDIALTGMNFFSIRRDFMLTVAGSIVTYEIIFLRFKSDQ